jgi:hypothetical protein
MQTEGDFFNNDIETIFGSGEVDVQNHFVLVSMLAEKWQKVLWTVTKKQLKLHCEGAGRRSYDGTKKIS